MILKVKKSVSRNPTEMIPKVKINHMKSHRDDSEGEISNSWNPTEMIPKYKKFSQIIPKGENFIS
jgi:hypothetical protein